MQAERLSHYLSEIKELKVTKELEISGSTM